MNISKDIKPITYLKSRAADLLKQISPTHRPVVITQNGEPKAILPWRIIYRISETRVYVLSVLDSRRNVEDILLKRLTGLKL